MATIKSTEEKAKRYDEAIKKAKDMLSYKEVRREDMEYLFPELKESEDDRIRKEIIIYLKSILSNKKYGDKFIESWIDWLEKQGKNNMGISEATKQNLEDNLNKALEKETPESCNEFLEKQYSQILANSAKTCKDEQKLAWSEEDNDMLYKVIHRIEQLDHYWNASTDEKMIDWLKFLKDRYTWKPSETQLETLKELSHDVPTKRGVIEELLKQLKQL